MQGMYIVKAAVMCVRTEEIEVNCGLMRHSEINPYDLNGSGHLFGPDFQLR